MSLFFAIVGIIAFAIGVAVVIDIAQRKVANRYFEEELEVLKRTFPDLFLNPGKYKVYTNGHPYVWVETEFESILTKLKSSCRGYRGAGVKPVYSIKVLPETSVYLVLQRQDFDFSKLKHYDTWLESQTNVQENITKHKNS